MTGVIVNRCTTALRVIFLRRAASGVGATNRAGSQDRYNRVKHGGPTKRCRLHTESDQPSLPISRARTRHITAEGRPESG